MYGRRHDFVFGARSPPPRPPPPTRRDARVPVVAAAAAIPTPRVPRRPPHRRDTPRRRARAPARAAHWSAVHHSQPPLLVRGPRTRRLQWRRHAPGSPGERENLRDARRRTSEFTSVTSPGPDTTYLPRHATHVAPHCGFHRDRSSRRRHYRATTHHCSTYENIIRSPSRSNSRSRSIREVSAVLIAPKERRECCKSRTTSNLTRVSAAAVRNSLF